MTRMRVFWLLSLALVLIAFRPLGQEIPPRPSIRLDGNNGQIATEAVFSYCWPLAQGNNQCDFLLEPTFQSPIEAEQGQTLTVIIDNSPSDPTQLTATITNADGVQGISLTPSSQAFIDEVLPVGENLIQIDATYADLAGVEAYITFVFKVNVFSTSDTGQGGAISPDATEETTLPEVTEVAMLETEEPVETVATEVVALPTEEITGDTTLEIPTEAPVETSEVIALPTEEVVEPTEEVIVTSEPTEEIIITAEPTEEVVVTDEPTEEVVITAEPTEEVVITAEPTEEAVVTDEPTEEVIVTDEPTEEVVVTDEPTATFTPTETPAEAAPTEEVTEATSTPAAESDTASPTPASSSARPTSTTVPLVEGSNFVPSAIPGTPTQTPIPPVPSLAPIEQPSTAPAAQLVFAGRAYAPSGISFCSVNESRQRVCVENPLDGGGQDIRLLQGFATQFQLVDSPRPAEIELSFLNASNFSEVASITRAGDKLILLNVEVPPNSYILRVSITWGTSNAEYFFRVRVN